MSDEGIDVSILSKSINSQAGRVRSQENKKSIKIKVRKLHIERRIGKKNSKV